MPKKYIGVISWEFIIVNPELLGEDKEKYMELINKLQETFAEIIKIHAKHLRIVREAFLEAKRKGDISV